MEVLNFICVPTWLISLAAIIATIYIYIKWKHGLWKRLGVPGPNPQSIFGILGAYKEKGRIQADSEVITKYGKIVGIYQGFQPCLLIADPEVIKRVTVKEFTTFPNRYLMVPPLRELKPGVLFAEDEHWKYVRNMLTPTFTSAKMRDMTPLIQKCCKQLLDNIQQRVSTGSAIDVAVIYGGYTLDVSASTSFGIDVDSQNDPHNEFVQAAKTFFDTSLSTPFQVFMILLPQFAKVASKLGIRPRILTEKISFLQKLVLSVLDIRKKEGSIRKDFLHLMVNAHNEKSVDDSEGAQSKGSKRGLSLDEITANSIIFLVAGYDTTASTLTFMSYNLAVNPECQEKVIKELDDVIGSDFPDYDSVQKLKYLDMVLSETLRLYGPFIRVNRRTESEIDIAGYKIPGNTEIAFPFHVIHRDPENWPDPEKFDPERFTPESKEKRHPYSYMPFGEGPRKCIGMRLAQLASKVAIVSILQKYRFVTCEETEIPMAIDAHGLIIRAKNGVKLKLKPRADHVIDNV